MTGPGETAAAAPKGNAEALRQKGRTTTILRRVRPVRTPKVQPAPAGNLSGTKTEAQNCRKWFCAFLCVQNVSGACPRRRRGVSTMRPESVQRLDKRSKRSKTSDGINVIRGKEHERTQTHPAVRDPCGGRRLHGGHCLQILVHDVPFARWRESMLWFSTLSVHVGSCFILQTTRGSPDRCPTTLRECFT